MAESEALQEALRKAVENFWRVRDAQLKKQAQKGSQDAGTRGAVTGGAQMGAVEALVLDQIKSMGLASLEVRTGQKLELPGYYRPEKKWDLLVLQSGKLVAAVEFKSQVGPSFGNNFNNRTEEAIGSANDLWTAFREGRFGTEVRPFLGYFFLLEDCPRVHSPVKNAEPHFKVDPVFVGASYAKRYELLLRRLVLENLYDAACLVLSPNQVPATFSHPSEDLTFKRFCAALQGHAVTFLKSQ